jgi:hypothetical protein
VDEDGSARVYRRVRRRPRRAALLSLVLLGNAVLQIIRTRHDVPLWWAPVALALLVAVGVWGVLTEWRARSVVTAAGVIRQGPLRARTWAWPAVYDLRVEPSGSNVLSTQPRWPAYLYDTEGRRFLLPHINEWQLEDPYAEVAALRAQARWYGMPAEQRPEIEAQIVRRAGQRKGWQWASATAVVVFALLAFALADDASGTPTSFLLLLAVPLAIFGVLIHLLQQATVRQSSVHLSDVLLGGVVTGVSQGLHSAARVPGSAERANGLHRRRRHQLPHRRPPGPPTPASPPPPNSPEPRSTANTHPAAATGNSNAQVPVRVRRPARSRPRTYYNKCRTRGKTHTQALLRLARQRINVLFAMLRDGTFYEPRTSRLA